MSVRRHLGPVVLALLLSARAHGAPCPDAGIVTIVGDDRSADATVQLSVSGSRVDGPGACDATGTGLATSYAAVLDCSGTGPTVCGRVGGLAPGVWIHRVSLQVGGSALQLQAQRSVVVAGATTSNVVAWTAFGRTFVVTQATGADLKAQLDAARAYTDAEPYPALVRFSPATFPGAGAPGTIPLQASCAQFATCQDNRVTAYCFEGADVTVDALDDAGLPGGVRWTVGTCDNSLLRLYGTDNVLRGLVLEGVTDPAASIAVDTVVIAGLASGGNRLEQCTILGPTKGDAVGVEGDSSQPGAGPAPENAIVASEITGAEDKGIKVDFGGVLRLERSCVHDNRNGGVQVTLGGTATAIENVVQHNVGGSAENGLFAGVPNVQDSQFPNLLAMRGNVVRFNGARGVSIVNNGTATLDADVVTDNYRAGLRVETTVAGVTPMLTVRGATFACNYAGICLSQSQACRVDADCNLQLCNPGSGTVTGVGLALDLPCVDCELPVIDLGAGGSDSGHSAFTLNANPASGGPGGVNLMSELATASPIPAAGNQWEHCDVPDPDPVNPNKCNVTQVAATDIRLGAGATPLFLGTPTGPRHGPAPSVTSISPARPHAGDLVRVYGGNFNAIDGAACHEPGVPADRCSIENAALADANAADVSQGNHVTVTIDGVDYPADVHQVTPAMLVFAMPIDCYAPGTLTVARGNDVAAPVALCDPGGCADGTPGALCDDHDVCTVGETCRGDGTCVPQGPLACNGPCLTGVCDSIAGCIPRDVTAACVDGDACTVGDHCSGIGDTCVPGSPRSCAAPCLTGACDASSGCIVSPSTTSCTDGDACTGGDHCAGVVATCAGSPIDCDDDEPCTMDTCDASQGCLHDAFPDGTTCPATDLCRGPATCRDGVCDPGPTLACDDGEACTDDRCDSVVGCTHVDRTGLPGVVCRVTQLRTLVATMPADAAALAARLGHRLDCAERRLMAAEAAARPRARTRALRRARRCIVRFIARVNTARQLDQFARDVLAAEGARALAALDALIAG